jgi:sugar/nucleoside kinase (ribokinase family)
MPQRIGVIGSFIRDTIFTLNGKTIESLGGLYHGVAYLAQLAAADTLIQPLCHVGDDFYPTVREKLSRLGSHIRFDHLHRVPQSNTQVKLIYRTKETRDEVTTTPMPPITSAEITAVAACDAVLVNLISGPDVELQALQALHASAPAPLVYLDLHSLALGIDAAGKRYYRGIPNWPEWAAACDILQMNEREAATLAGFGEHATEEDLLKFGHQLMAEKLHACHITLGSAGSLLFYREHDQIRHEHCPPLPLPQVVDIIGCGDAFGAAFLTHYLQTKNLSVAAHFANKVAGLNATFMGSLTPEVFQQVVEPQLMTDL